MNTLQTYTTEQTEQPATHVQRSIGFNFTSEHTDALEKSLSFLLPGKEEETKVTQARRILGETVNHLSDEELEVKVAQFQFLLECWMDRFERSIFCGNTLKQLTRGE